MNTETMNAPEISPIASIIKPIQLGISQPEIDKLAEQYKKLTIAGPSDKTGFKVVYDARQIVKRTRIGVDRKRKELKADAIAYTKQVDQVAGVLIGDLAQIEDHLEREEKAYNDERERIAHEKAMAQQQRTEGRVKQLKAYNFEWNPTSERYEFDDVSILFEDIKTLEDEQWEPVRYSAEYAHRLEQDRLADIQRAKDEEAARLAAEQQAIAEQQEAERLRLQALADENRRAAHELQVKQNEFDRVQREAAEERIRLEKAADDERRRKYDEEAAVEMKAQKEAEHAEWLAEQARMEKQAAADEAARKKADKERAKRLAPDKNKLNKFFVVTGNTPATDVKEAESIDLQIEFIGRLHELVREFQARLTDL